VAGARLRIAPAGIGRQKNVLPWVVPLGLLGAWGERKIRERILGPAAAVPATGLARTFGDMMRAIRQHVNPRMETLPRLDDASLAALGMPLLTILGGKDVMLDSADTNRRLERALPCAEIELRPDARHHPGECTREVLDFLVRSAEPSGLGERAGSARERQGAARASCASHLGDVA